LADERVAGLPERVDEKAQIFQTVNEVGYGMGSFFVEVIFHCEVADFGEGGGVLKDRPFGTFAVHFQEVNRTAYALQSLGQGCDGDVSGIGWDGGAFESGALAVHGGPRGGASNAFGEDPDVEGGGVSLDDGEEDWIGLVAVDVSFREVVSSEKGE
jgi:hypothetical protein